jgi:hypothetical protein
VKASSLRLASRIVNSLGAGEPAQHIDKLAEASLIILSVPERILPDSIAELQSADIGWTNKVLVLFDSPADSRLLQEIRAMGAGTATLNTIPALNHAAFLLEGQRQAARTVRKLLMDAHTRTIEVTRGSKMEALIGLELATAAVPAIAGAVSASFRRAGMTKGQAESTAGPLIQNAIRAHFRAARSGRGQLEAEEKERLIRAVSDALHRTG